MIKYHYEKEEEKFKDCCREIMLDLYALNKIDCAEMIAVYISERSQQNVWCATDPETEIEKMKKEIRQLEERLKKKKDLFVKFLQRKKINYKND